MRHFSPRQADELKWVTVVFFLAALYNIVWGAIAAIAPREMLAFFGIGNPGYPGFWQCIGMFVALYGVGYWLASTEPSRYWPFVLIGLIGKVLGPIGSAAGIAGGDLPPSFFWINVTNDFIWWVPFAWALYAIRRCNIEAITAQPRSVALYRRVIGPEFEGMAPRIRSFHSATQRMEVRGTFRVTRGDSSLGNRLTDMARFPRAQEGLGVSLVVEPDTRGETWRRSFGGTIVESRQYEVHGFLVEQFGPLCLYLDPRVVEGALEVTDVRATFLGVPLPPLLTPRIWAHGIDNGSTIEVVVRISNALCGLLVEYRGTVA